MAPRLPLILLAAAVLTGACASPEPEVPPPNPMPWQPPEPPVHPDLRVRFTVLNESGSPVQAAMAGSRLTFDASYSTSVYAIAGLALVIDNGTRSHVLSLPTDLMRVSHPFSEPGTYRLTLFGVDETGKQSAWKRTLGIHSEETFLVAFDVGAPVGAEARCEREPAPWLQSVPIEVLPGTKRIVAHVDVQNPAGGWPLDAASYILCGPDGSISPVGRGTGGVEAKGPFESLEARLAIAAHLPATTVSGSLLVEL